jgi:hypothetical protein
MGPYVYLKLINGEPRIGGGERKKKKRKRDKA